MCKQKDKQEDAFNDSFTSGAFNDGFASGFFVGLTAGAVFILVLLKLFPPPGS